MTFDSGQYVYIRFGGGLTKWMYVEPHSDGFFIGADYWGDRYLISTNLLYATGDVEDQWRIEEKDMWMYKGL